MIWDSNTPQFLHLQAMVKIVQKWELKKKTANFPILLSRASPIFSARLSRAWLVDCWARKPN